MACRLSHSFGNICLTSSAVNSYRVLTLMALSCQRPRKPAAASASSVRFQRQRCQEMLVQRIRRKPWMNRRQSMTDFCCFVVHILCIIQCIVWFYMLNFIGFLCKCIRCRSLYLVCVAIHVQYSLRSYILQIMF